MANPPVPKPDDDVADGESKPFLDHLEDLRKTLIRCAVVLVLGMCVAGPMAHWIMKVLTLPLSSVTEHPGSYLQSTDVVGGVTLFMQIMLWAGLIFSAPAMIYFIGAFIFPGLTNKEKRVILRTSGAAVGLFMMGILLGYKLLPVALKIMKGFHDWMQLNVMWTSRSYFTFVLQLLLAFGLVFEMPVVLLILGKLGIIKVHQLVEKRRHVYVLLFIIAAVLTPPDVISQCVMAVPMIFLYEITIFLLRGTERRKAAAAAAEEK